MKCKGRIRHIVRTIFKMHRLQLRGDLTLSGQKNQFSFTLFASMMCKEDVAETIFNY